MRFEIREYDPSMKELWKEMFVRYARDDLGDDLAEEILREKIAEGVFLKSWEKGVCSLAAAFVGSMPAGFAVYQVDSGESDWCKRPGWGLIREFCIVPEFRGRGYGTALAKYAVERLLERTDRIYLTANVPEEDGGRALRFWQSCGFRETGEVNKNGTRTMELEQKTE